LKLCTPSFLMISRVARSPPTSKPEGCWIEQETAGWSLTSMGRGRRPESQALPQTDDLPPAFRRLDDVCAPFYTGRKRGQVVRTRTAHSVKPTVSSGSARLAIAATGDTERNCERRAPPSHVTLRRTSSHRLAPYSISLANTALERYSLRLSGFAFVTRGKEYTALDHPQVQARLHLPPDQFQQRTAKSDNAQPLRLPRSASGTRGRAVARGGGNPPRRQQEESRWRHAVRRRLRTLLHEPAAAGLHCC
jgi:hypothetical protein